MAQLVPLPLTVSCSSKIQIGFIFLVPAHLSSPGQRAVKRMCVCVSVVFFLHNINVCSFVKKNTVGRRRRNSFFVSGVSQAKMITLQIHGLSDEVSTHTQLFNGHRSGTTRVGRYQKKHSPTHTHPHHRTSFISFLHLLRSIASSVFSLHAWQFSLTTSFQVFFGLSLGLEPSTSYSMHFFTQSSSFLCSACPYQCSLFCCNTNAMSSIPSLSLSSLLGNLSFSLTPQIYLTILISARWSATTFSFFTGQVSLPCNMLLRTQLLYNLPLIINDTSLLGEVVLPATWTYSNQYKFWPPQLHQHLLPHSACYLGYKALPYCHNHQTPSFTYYHFYQIICTSFKKEQPATFLTRNLSKNYLIELSELTGHSKNIFNVVSYKNMHGIICLYVNRSTELFQMKLNYMKSDKIGKNHHTEHMSKIHFIVCATVLLHQHSVVWIGVSAWICIARNR